MNETVEVRLLALNREFYRQFARSFIETRTSPQQGFFKLLDYLPQQSQGHLLDVGCGDGRFGRFSLAHGLVKYYSGVDFSAEMIEAARGLTEGGEFFQRDLSRAECLAGLGAYELISCLATLQHIPGRDNRLRLLQEMAAHLVPHGRILLSNWQFMDSIRQRKKIAGWQEVGVNEEDVEPNDYLLTWRRDGVGYRYVSLIDEGETAELAKAAGLRMLAQFRSDGREGNLNLYCILAV
jgi:SAM-dependent methyltransferase